LENEPKSTRRRGKVLEDAILTAAWEQLQQHGYLGMTMDDIAKAAHTNKNAIYRRWPTKLDVTTATLMTHVSLKDFYLPDTGHLRSDVVAFLSESIPLINAIGVKNIKEIARDRILNIQNVLAARAKQEPPKKGPTLQENIVVQYLKTILQRAFQRGELATDPKDFDGVILNLPVLLILSRLISESTYDRQTIEFFVDKVLLPVFKAQ
jgi:AcrR family transcriptional regulator